MGRLDGRVVVITGAGRGLGRAYARLAGAEGARVVVNDLGRALDGGGEVTAAPADEVVAEIRADGGSAVVNHDDVADAQGAERLLETALTAFGTVDVLVNNAGILRDRMLVNATDEDWDDVLRVHLRGHFCPTRAFARYWRDRVRSRPGVAPDDAVIVHTTSISGLYGNVGQTSYAVAKSGIATLALQCHLELHERYGVRAYAIGPGARTRLTESSPPAAQIVAAPEAADTFDYYSPDNVSPFVVWLAAAACPAPSGTVYTVEGDQLALVRSWTESARATAGGQRWTLDDLDRDVPALVAGARA